MHRASSSYRRDQWSTFQHSPEESFEKVTRLQILIAILTRKLLKHFNDQQGEKVCLDVTALTIDDASQEIYSTKLLSRFNT